MRYGWCLDWLGQTAESARYFDRAAELEPNSYYIDANIGLHYVQTGDLAAAKPWFERSLHLERAGNAIALNYLQIVTRPDDGGGDERNQRQAQRTAALTWNWPGICGINGPMNAHSSGKSRAKKSL